MAFEVNPTKETENFEKDTFFSHTHAKKLFEAFLFEIFIKGREEDKEENLLIESIHIFNFFQHEKKNMR
jgi:hypothetical protein